MADVKKAGPKTPTIKALTKQCRKAIKKKCDKGNKNKVAADRCTTVYMSVVGKTMTNPGEVNKACAFKSLAKAKAFIKANKK
jgi:esterase/lipase superfamily enzyme